jgi:predicted MFS family arabinose efflux permease
LTGELLGAGVGFFITGDLPAISWRAAFLILAFPAFALAWQVHLLPEPARGGATSLAVGPTRSKPELHVRMTAAHRLRRPGQC